MTLDVKLYAYAKYVAPSKREHLFVQFATTSMAEFMEAAGAQREKMRDAAMRAACIERVLGAQGTPQKVQPIYNHFIPIFDESGLPQTEPVLYIGEHEHPASAHEALDMTTSGCIIAAQLFHGSQKKKPKEFTPVKLREYLLTNFVYPLMCAYADRNQDTIHKRRVQLFAFAHGSPFINDVTRLCSELEKGNRSPDLVNAYLDKMCAVHAQEYELAAQMRDRIRRLTNDRQ